MEYEEYNVKQAQTELFSQEEERYVTEDAEITREAEESLEEKNSKRKQNGHNDMKRESKRRRLERLVEWGEGSSSQEDEGLEQLMKLRRQSKQASRIGQREM